MSIQEDRQYTIQEAAFYVGLTYQSVYLAIRTKRLPASRFGGVWSIKGCDLLAYDASRKARIGA